MLNDERQKVLFVGNAGSGKSTFLSAISGKAFISTYLTTIGIDLGFITRRAEKRSIKHTIIDTAGQERFRSIMNSYYKGSDAAYVFVDLNENFDAKAVRSVQGWVNAILKYSEIDKKKIVFVGTKADLLAGDPITLNLRIKSLEDLAKELGICETVYCKSAKTIAESNKYDASEFLGIIPVDSVKGFKIPVESSKAKVVFNKNYKAVVRNLDHEATFSDEKWAILNQLTNQIDRIHSARGWVLNQDNNKANVLINLYKALYDEPEDERLIDHITEWNTDKNKAILSASRSHITLFSCMPTTSITLIKNITKDAKNLKNNGSSFTV